MLGTDYPFPLGELQPGSLIESMDEFDETLKVTKFLLYLKMQIQEKLLMVTMQIVFWKNELSFYILQYA